ncbi:MAG: M48 family metallopeptidase [Spirochaetes bacterium]|nr:M48 family metallopeptidase [Spirochaetota bacterium]
MKYTPKILNDYFNISKRSPIADFFILVSISLGILLAVYFLLGFAVDLIVPHIPIQVEKTLGKIFTLQYNSNKKASENKYISMVLSGMVKQLPSSHQKRDYRIRIVPDQEINALALPGGNIILFTGLLDRVRSENELAFVIGHELGHFSNRDHLKRMGRSLVIIMVSFTLLGQDNSISKFLVNTLIGAQMKYSQKQELEADLIAVELLNKQYGHVAGALDFFNRIKSEGNFSRILSYFSTHPHTKDRAEVLKEVIEKRDYLTKKRRPLKRKLY